MPRSAKRPGLFVVLTVLLAIPGAEPAVGYASEPPNIVLFLADDLGWTDLGCQGSDYYRTPRIDALARQGLRFTAAYSCGPNCAPTRACLQSGLYVPRHGVYTVGSGARGRARHRRLVPAENRTSLHPSFSTVAELLRERGYATAHFGKWHLGAPGRAGPREQGYDRNAGGTRAGHPRSYFSPYHNPRLPDGPEGENLTDRMGREAARFVREHADGPFFAHVAFYAVHTPLQAKDGLVEAYRRRRRGARHRNPVYAAMVETLDRAVGRVLDALEETGVAQRTLVVFTSDNGGVGGYRAAGIEGGREITTQEPLRGGKGMLYEGGIRVPCIVRWPGVVRPGGVCAEPVTSVDLLPTFAGAAGAGMPGRLDGRSILPLLRDPRAGLERDALYWHFPGYLQADARRGTWRTRPAGALRAGRWKLIEFFEDSRLELYDLARDPGETRDLAAERPELRDRLHDRLRAWREATGAPMPRPKRDGERAGR